MWFIISSSICKLLFSSSELVERMDGWRALDACSDIAGILRLLITKKVENLSKLNENYVLKRYIVGCEKIINIIEIRFISNYNFNWFEVIQKDLFIATHFWVLPRRWCSGRGARWWCHIYLKVLLADEWQWVGKCVASFHNGPTPSDIYISCSNSIYDHCICGRGTGKLFQIAHEWEDMAI